MNFECLLLSAKAGNEDAITAILQMYRPLLLKYAIIDCMAATLCTASFFRKVFRSSVVNPILSFVI